MSSKSREKSSCLGNLLLRKTMRLDWKNSFVLSLTISLFLVLTLTPTPASSFQTRGHPPPGPPPPPPPRRSHNHAHPHHNSRDIPHRLGPHKSSHASGSHHPPGPPPPPMGRGQRPPPHPSSSLHPMNKLAHHHGGKMPFATSGDLHPAAQTLYDLRGFHIPLGGQEETQRFLRQQQNHHQLNDPFSRPSGFHPSNNNNNHQNNNNHENSLNNNNNNHNNDPRTAPLVFPSFYQQQHQNQQSEVKRPQQILNIFGHSQHLSQTKYEPADQQNELPGGGGPGGFRPSQLDVASQFPNSRPSPTPQPQRIQPQQGQGHLSHLNEQTPKPSGSNQLNNNIPHGRQVGGQQILNYRAPQLPQNDQNNRPANSNNNLNQAQSEEPFIYVYDDEDYEEGEEDDFLDKPQQQINTNRVTTPRPTKAPLRSHVSTPTPSPIRHSTPTAKSVSTTTAQAIALNHQNQNDFFQQNHSPPPQNNFFFNNNNNNNNQENQFFQSNPFSQNQSPSPRPPSVTPRPNVEINPSSERKPPPDQSNAIIPVLQQGNNNNHAPPRIQEDRFRRPATSTIRPEISQNNFYRQNHQEPKHNFFPQSNDNNNQRDPFGQVVNLNEEEEEQIYEQEPNLIQKLNPFSNSGNRFQEPPSRLRPVNTIVPKNRVPQEDIVLPPNFHENYEDKHVIRNELTTTGPTRGDVIRHNSRPQTTSEFTPTLQRVTSSRPTQTPAPIQPQPPRVRGSSIRFPTTSQTTEGTTEGPKRIRNRIRPNRITTSLATTPPSTTTTTTTFRTFKTTPTPSYDETSSEYYEDDYIANNPPPRVVDNFQEARPSPTPSPRPPVSKSSIRPFFSNNQIQELNSPKYSLAPEVPTPRRVRPVSSTTPTSFYSKQTSTLRGRVTPTSSPYGSGNKKHHREQTTIESPPSKTTTGKPLYYAGKMLSKEGGLYAGQTIPASHMYGYGSPVPSLPINSVFDKMPAVLDGKVARPSLAKNHHINQNQQRVRGRDHLQKAVTADVPSSTSTPTHNSRLIHPSRIRPTVGHANRVQQTPPESQANQETFREPPVRGSQTSQRPSSFPKFNSRPQTTPEPQQSEQPSQGQPPRRRRVRPGQKFRPQNPPQAETHTQTTEIVSIRESVSEEVSDHEDLPVQQQPRAPRPHRIRPAISQSVSSSTTTEDTPSSSSAAKLRPRRPRPNKNQKFTSTAPSPVDEDEEDLPKPPRRLRPRVRPGRLALKQSTLQPDFSESITQNSVKIGRKPTEAPGRFSSRFRDESSSTVLATQPTLNVEETFTSENVKPKPTFKPFKSSRPAVPIQPIKPKRRPQQQQQNPDDPEDALPPSIRLSAKDVVLNRKPARRIPPGSASDRLKALQERRRKLSPNNRKQPENHDEEDEQESRPQERVARRRKLTKKLRKKPEPEIQEHNDENQHEDDYEPQPNQPETAVQNKREITYKTSAGLKPDNEIEYQETYDNKDDEYNNRDEYDTLDKDRQKQVEHQKLQISTSRSAIRNPSEVSSDEARSVLGITRPSTPTVKQPKQLKDDEEDHAQEDENYYGETEYDYEGHGQPAIDKKSTEFPPSKVTIRKTESSSESPSSSTTTVKTPSSSSAKSKANKNSRISPSFVTSTSTSATTSVSESTLDEHEVEKSDNTKNSSPDSTSPSSASTTAATSLKSRLRPNKKLLSSIQPRMSASQQREKNESTRHSNLSKFLKLRTSSSNYSPLPSSTQPTKLFTMSTEDPSLPLESIFPVVSS